MYLVPNSMNFAMVQTFSGPENCTKQGFPAKPE